MRPLPIPPYQVPDVHVQPPMVYVEPAWEYKQVTRHLTHEELPSEAELNALGRDGWELTGVVSAASTVHFYFKRQTQ